MKTQLAAFFLGILFLGLPVGSVLATGASSTEKAACHGRIFNPITDPDWNDFFPLTIAGVPAGPNQDPSLMYEPPVCVCPGIFGLPSVGVGITYWQPMYISEVQKIAGCSSSLGGTLLVSGYEGLNSEQALYETGKGDTHSTRMQLHWYQYPVFSVLNMFGSLVCRNMGGFNLLYASEVDPTWQNDVWAGIFSPETALFAQLPIQASCAVDSVGALFGHPVDAMFWCAGTWGSVYPMAGTAAQSSSTFQVNNLILAKFLARQARLGLQWQTIGPLAECNSVPNPVWLKSQYRVDQVYPIDRRGRPLVIGAPPIGQVPFMITNPPGLDDTVNLIWEGMQCCIRGY